MAVSGAKVTYTPQPDYFNTASTADTFSFIVNDGALDSKAAMVSIQVNAVNDPPSVQDQAVNLDKNASAVITVVGSDVDTNPAALTYEIVKSPKKGTVDNLGKGQFKYKPQANFTGTDSFTVVASDGLIKSKPAMVNLTIQASTGQTQTGQFVGPTVAGLRYETATQSGLTTAKGEFVYKTGEQVTFKVGDIVLGTVAAAPKMTVFTLAGIANPPVQAIDINREINRLNSNVMPTPFEVATNLAVFLQTIDDDFNAANGIVIPSQLQTIAQGSKVEFRSRQVKVKNFAQSYPLRYLIGSGRLAGLWGGKRPIRSYKYALDNVYAALGLMPQVYAPAKFEKPYSSGEGSNITISTYDKQGNLKVFDTAVVNGTQTSLINRYTYNYNGNGDIIQEDSDATGNGTITNRNSYQYDANGYLTTVTVTNPSSSNGNASLYSSTYQYDNYGNVIDEYNYSNNIPTEHVHYSYDTNARHLLSASYDYSINRVGPIDGIEDARMDYQYVYNTLGNIAKKTVKSLRNNQTYLQIYEYDESGNLTNQYETVNAIIIYGNLYSYKDNCLIKEEAYEKSSVNITNTINYVCDSQKNVLTQITDRETKWQFDTIGNLLQKTETYNNSLTDELTFKYDVKTGNLLSYTPSINALKPNKYTYTQTNKWTSLNFAQPFKDYLKPSL